jgi:hypothetical protein
LLQKLENEMNWRKERLSSSSVSATGHDDDFLIGGL